jgi:type II secretory pathway component PulF
MKTLLASLQSNVREGKGFSEALGNFSDWFGDFYVNLVKAGEASGGLETVLNNLAQYLEKEIEIRNRFFQAVAYPIFVLVFRFLTIVIMLVGIIPKLSELYSGMGASLPFLTRLVMGLSQGILDYWWLAVIAIMSLVLFLKGLARKGNMVLIDRWRLRVPLFGEIHQKDEVGRIARALGMLVQNGIPIVESLKMTVSILRNRLLQEGMARIQSEVSQGKSLSQAMAAVGWFTRGASHLVLVGEESGRLEQAFQKLSEIYEKEIDQKMRLLTALLEPAMIVLVGGLVGIVVIAMLLPIFQMSLLTQ